MRSCPECGEPQYGWDGLQRHLERGWCKKAGKKTPEEAQQIVNQTISGYLAAKEEEYQMMDEYDRKHNLGAYSY